MDFYSFCQNCVFHVDECAVDCAAQTQFHRHLWSIVLCNCDFVASRTPNTFDFCLILHKCRRNRHNKFYVHHVDQSQNEPYYPMLRCFHLSAIHRVDIRHHLRWKWDGKKTNWFAKWSIGRYMQNSFFNFYFYLYTNIVSNKKLKISVYFLFGNMRRDAHTKYCLIVQKKKKMFIQWIDYNRVNDYVHF